MQEEPQFFLIDLVEKWQYTKHKWFKMYTFWHSEINTISSGYVVNQTLHSRFFVCIKKYRLWNQLRPVSSVGTDKIYWSVDMGKGLNAQQKAGKK